jgi:cytochrome c peroxidase
MRRFAVLGTAVFMLGVFAPGRAGSPAWTSAELAVLASLRLDEPQPVADSAATVALGRQLFFDVRFSRDQSVACASCHDPARYFQDGRPVGQGVGAGSRRSMPVVAAGSGTWLFWDGRKDSLWSQALGPLEDPREHGSNRLRIARLLGQYYPTEYGDAFGAMPALDHLPGDASPLGTTVEQAAWRLLLPVEQQAVSRVFANMGKAIAAYERTLHHQPSRFDLYVDSLLDRDAANVAVLSAREIRGLRVFVGKGQCVSCHNGPQLTDQQFHNTGVPTRDPHRPDAGRAAAIEALRTDEFNCLGPFSDKATDQCMELQFLAEDEASLQGAFKTPGLRDVSKRPPYMHAGQFLSLEEVVRHYDHAPAAALGISELRRTRSGQGRPPLHLSAQERRDLIAFLNVL